MTSILEIEVSGADTPGNYIVQIESPAGEASATFTLDPSEFIERLGDFQQNLLASSVPSRRLLSHGEASVRGVGRRLFEALFSQHPVAGVYRASYAVAAERGDTLRMVLRLNAPEIAALPWESMFDEAVGSYVCRREPLVRYVSVASSPPPLTVQLPLRILALVASPRGLAALDVEKEREDLARALAAPIERGLVVLHWLEHTTWADLQDALLSESWHVVHFIGHGDFDNERDEGVLALETEAGRVHRVSAENFVDLLREAQPMPRLVVLNACESSTSDGADMFSGTAATLVRGGVSAVTAMQFEISDQAAIAFGRGFYAAIARGRGVDEAVRSGRVAILGLGDGSLEWITPTLYLRGRETQLFAVSQSPGPLSPPPILQDRRNQAMAASEAPDLSSALPPYDSVLADNPQDTEIHQARERAVASAAQPNNAISAERKNTRDIDSAEHAHRLHVLNRLASADREDAAAWYSAADAGDIDAMFRLGLLLAERLDPPDLNGARTWFTRAAAAGDPRAMNNLGNVLANQLDPPDLNGGSPRHAAVPETEAPTEIYDASMMRPDGDRGATALGPDPGPVIEPSPFGQTPTINDGFVVSPAARTDADRPLFDSTFIAAIPPTHRPRRGLSIWLTVAVVVVVIAVVAVTAVVKGGQGTTVIDGAGLSALPVSPPLPDAAIVAVRQFEGGHDLFVIDSETGQIGQRLTTGGADGPVYSPDRRSIVYTTSTSNTEGSIRVVAADGTGDRDLFSPAIEGCSRYLTPAWNPVQQDELALPCLTVDDKFSMRLVRLDGTVIRTFDTEGGWVNDPSFSPDGRAIAYNYNADPTLPGGSIRTVLADGSEPPIALTGPTTDSQPMWSPDGTKILFRRELGPDHRHAVYVMSAWGSDQHAVGESSADDREPAWSPDGSDIVFRSNRDQVDTTIYRFYLMDPTGSDVRPLSPDDTAPAFLSVIAWARR